MKCYKLKCVDKKKNIVRKILEMSVIRCFKSDCTNEYLCRFPA